MSLPAANRMFITSAWLESIIYGMHPSAGRRRDSVLIIRPAGVNTKRYIGLRKSCDNIRPQRKYHIIILPQEHNLNEDDVEIALALYLLLTWRLYVVWNRNWILAFVMLILEAGQLATSVVGWAALQCFVLRLCSNHELGEYFPRPGFTALAPASILCASSGGLAVGGAMCLRWHANHQKSLSDWAEDPIIQNQRCSAVSRALAERLLLPIRLHDLPALCLQLVDL
ncbi:hypothetical protein EDB19DRAFT_1999728 [Suillus lakei]|nr:hypothetical protein EDB19DRAFT_1999728 [Suillus lakei]